MSRVDVIVPCYNYGRFLRECVESVLCQPVDVRVLIIDDASTDETPEVAAALASEDSRVEFRRHLANRGHIATYNEGLEWISGEYTLLLSADDLLAPGALKRASDLMDMHSDVVFVYGKLIRWRSGEPKPFCPPVTQTTEWHMVSGLEWIERVCRDDPPTTSPEVVVRTGLQRQLGPYRPELPHWADVEMLLKFAAHGSVGYINTTQAYYRLHSDNMHIAYRGLHDLKQRKCTFEMFFDYCCGLSHDASSLREVAMRNVAEMAFWDAHEAFDGNDLEYCKACLEFAEETNTEIRRWKHYRRFRIKLALGPKRWGWIRPAWHRMRFGRVDTSVS